MSFWSISAKLVRLSTSKLITLRGGLLMHPEPKRPDGIGGMAVAGLSPLPVAKEDIWEEECKVGPNTQMKWMTPYVT